MTRQVRACLHCYWIDPIIRRRQRQAACSQGPCRCRRFRPARARTFVRQPLVGASLARQQSAASGQPVGVQSAEHAVAARHDQNSCVANGLGSPMRQATAKRRGVGSRPLTTGGCVGLGPWPRRKQPRQPDAVTATPGGRGRPEPAEDVHNGGRRVGRRTGRERWRSRREHGGVVRVAPPRPPSTRRARAEPGACARVAFDETARDTGGEGRIPGAKVPWPGR